MHKSQSLFNLIIALNVSGVTITHLQEHKCKDVFISRIPLILTDLPFDFKRLQSPVRLAFAMSINKAQEQSMEIAGIHLENPCFSIGQLYVARSRVANTTNLYILVPERKTETLYIQQHFGDFSDRI